MRSVLIIAAFFLLASCDLFTSKEIKTQELVNQELKNIDFNDVDQFPLFVNCDETNTKIANRACFEDTLLKHFSKALGDFEFVLKEEVADTLYVDFVMDKEGMIAVLDIENNAIMEQQLPEFDAIIERCLLTLPRATPALKRGIPVRAKFRIPIILNTK